MIGPYALGVILLGQSHRKPPGDGLAEYSHLSFGAMRKTYPINRPMRFKVLSQADLPDPIIITLEMLEQHSAEQGIPAFSSFTSVMEDIFSKRESENGHFVTVPPRRPFVVRWNPSAQPRYYKPMVGATYRLCLITRGALLGGGAAFWSTSFHFTGTTPHRRRR